MSGITNSPVRRRSALTVGSVVAAAALALLLPAGGSGVGAQTTTTTCVTITIPGGGTATSLVCTDGATTTSSIPQAQQAPTSTTSTSTSSTSTTTTSTTATTTTSTTASTTTSTTAAATTTTVAPVLRLSSNRLAPGERVTVAGDRLAPNTVYRINFLSQPVELATATSNASGSFQTVVTIPSTATPGAHQINITDPSGRVVATVDLTVTGTASTGGGGGLARTGANAVGLAMLAATAIVGGWLVLSQFQAFVRNRRWQ